MDNPLDTFPYPWNEPDARELHDALTQIYPSQSAARFIAQAVRVPVAQVNWEQPVFFIWQAILDKTATAKTTRDLVRIVVEQNPTNPWQPFFAALLESRPTVVDHQPRDARNKALFLRGDDAISVPEALLFQDDLTLAIGRVGWLIGALQRLVELAPSVCKLEVTTLDRRQHGTAFRIGEDLLLTNWHVLHLFGTPTSILAEFGYDDDGLGGVLASTAIRCDVGTVVVDREDDWGVVRVADRLPASLPVLRLSSASEPTRGQQAFIIQHPGGERKRLAYVRNQVTDADDRVVHYLSDTQAGSSGSPVLNDAGQLIALHHAGGTPQEVAGRPPLKKNEGIRIGRVAAGLRAAGIQPA